jgi:glutathione S-transferase
MCNVVAARTVLPFEASAKISDKSRTSSLGLAAMRSTHRTYHNNALVALRVTAHPERMTNPELTLYFSPLSCSFSSRSILYDVEANVRFVEVRADKTTADGKDFRTINPLGLVPALALEDGEILTENAAVLQYLGERYPERGLIPTDARERTRMRSWLSFIGAELHKTVFAPILGSATTREVKAWALAKADERLSIAAAKIGNRPSVLASGVSVADAYMTAVLNWIPATGLDLKKWPGLVQYRATMLERPSFARAFKEERGLWAERNPVQAKALGLVPANPS